MHVLNLANHTQAYGLPRQGSDVNHESMPNHVLGHIANEFQSESQERNVDDPTLLRDRLWVILDEVAAKPCSRVDPSGSSTPFHRSIASATASDPGGQPVAVMPDNGITLRASDHQKNGTGAVAYLGIGEYHDCLGKYHCLLLGRAGCKDRLHVKSVGFIGNAPAFSRHGLCIAKG
jgi:hypothetical protein